jgi:hypothetical protein
MANSCPVRINICIELDFAAVAATGGPEDSSPNSVGSKCQPLIWDATMDLSAWLPFSVNLEDDCFGHDNGGQVASWPTIETCKQIYPHLGQCKYRRPAPGIL